MLNYGIRYEYKPFFTRRCRSPSSPSQSCTERSRLALNEPAAVLFLPRPEPRAPSSRLLFY